MEKEIKWGNSNFLRSIKGNLIVVSTPSSNKDSEFFEGVVINADESEHNTILTHSNTFRKNKFELLTVDEIKVNFK